MKNSEFIKKWRFWPILILAFLYPMNVALIGLAIPIYFFRLGVAIELIAILASGTTITYCFSPIISSKISTKITKRRAVILGVIGISLSQLVFFFTLEPILFLISRMIEGFMAGFIWSNLQSCISDNTEHDHSKYMAKYNASWNIGIISGYLLGALTLFFIDDLKIVFYLAPILIFINIIIIIIFFQESVNLNNNNPQSEKKRLDDHSQDNLHTYQESNAEPTKGNIVNFAKYSIPITFPIIIIIIYCLARTSTTFLYPLKSEILGFEAYSVYLLSFIGFITQVVSITITSYLFLERLKRIPVISSIALIILLILLGLNSNFLVFVFLFLLFGFFTGTLYSTSLKIFLSFNIKNNTSKYSSMFESLIGLTFLLGPIMIAFVVKIDINLGFYLIATIFSILVVVILLFIRKIEVEVNNS